MGPVDILRKEVEGLRAEIREKHEYVLALEERLRRVEYFRHSLPDRPPMKIPKFPQVLRDIGLHPPEVRNPS